MKVKLLFVTKHCDPVLYRVNIGWLLEEIDQNLFEVDVVECFQRDISEKLMRSDIIIYYRVMGFDFSGVFMAREAGKVIGYMVDDYLLDFEFGHFVYEFMQYVDFNIVTTPILRDLYLAAGIRSPFYIKIHGLPISRLLALQTPKIKKEQESLRIGWLGGLTHHILTPHVEEMLRVLSAKAVSTTLISFGKPEEFVQRVCTLPYIMVENLPFIPFENETAYYSTIANVGFDMVVNFIPWNKLGEGKSQLKYLETGLYHIPLITANLGIWSMVIKHGVNGLLAETPLDFAEKVIYLKNNPEIQMAIGENAFQDVVNNYHIKLRAQELGEYLRKFYHEKKRP